jgi:TonB family protein
MREAMREATRKTRQVERREASAETSAELLAESSVEMEAIPDGVMVEDIASRSREMESSRETDEGVSVAVSGAQGREGETVEVAGAGDMSREAVGSSGGVAGEVGGTDESKESGVSDSESDPFTTRHGVEFRPGGTLARGGREIKARRPRVDLAFLADATRLGRPIGMTFRVSIDERGSVDRVDVVRSSGSGHIDDAVRLAIYESRFGPPAPAEFLFGVSLR